MLRLTLLLLAVLAVAAPASASADQLFLGLTEDGEVARFTAGAPTALASPRPVAGVAAGDRLVVLSGGLALGRSGRVYRFEAEARRATPTPVRFALSGSSFSLIPTTTGVRVLGDSGMDATADLATGAITPGAGLRLGDGTVVTGAFAALPDGRLTGVLPARGTLATETAPGSGVVAERRLRPTRGELRFRNPVAFMLTADGAYVITRFAEARIRQSMLLAIDLATGAVKGDSGPYFWQVVRSALPLGTIPDDKTPPRVTRVQVPRTISLRDLQVNRRVRVSLRCSEGCTVLAGTAVGGRTNAVTGISRSTPGTVTVRLYRLFRREADLLRPRIGRPTIMRFFVEDWQRNRVVVERRFRLTR